MNQQACGPTSSRYFTNTRPTLRSLGQLLLPSSIFSALLREAFSGRCTFLAINSGNIHVFFPAMFFPCHRFYIRPSLLSDVAAFGDCCFFHRLDTPGYVRVSPFFSYLVLVEKLHYICIRNGGSLSCILALSTHEHRRWTLLSRHLLVRRLLLFQQNNG